MMMNKLLECVPNYSEGRDMQKVEQIVDCFRGKKGVKLWIIRRIRITTAAL